MAFNSIEPVLAVGDSKGRVHSFKLSPNLRMKSKEAAAAVANGEMKLFKKIEVQKIKKILEQVVTLPTDSMKDK